MVAVFAFFFVTVSSRIVGLVGVTSNPTSGMTIATLLGTSGVFLAFGWTDMQGQAAALTVGAVVAIAASIAGDTSQDLKTGFLLGATPVRQQKGELIGVLTSAFFVALTLSVLSEAYGFGTRDLPAPQANMMKIVIEGVLSQDLPWLLVGIGAVIAILAEIAGIPSLAFAVGIYLPLATMSPVFVGGLIRWIAERRARNEEDRRDRRERGILFGSGLVGGEGLLGVGIASYAVLTARAPEGIGSEWAGGLAPWVPVIPFAFLLWMLWRAAQAGASKGD
jgi:putative OPT family oligopeptide transporter